jgi:hypothetical protein
VLPKNKNHREIFVSYRFPLIKTHQVVSHLFPSFVSQSEPAHRHHGTREFHKQFSVLRAEKNVLLSFSSVTVKSVLCNFGKAN